MRTTYKQAKDILNAVRNFYRQLAEFYAGLAHSADKERVRMLLDYMSRHEKNFERALAEYDENEGRELLETWIQFAPDTDALAIPQMRNLHGDMTIDDVVNIAMELDDRLVRFYSEAADRVDSSYLRDLFEKMKEYEEAEEAEIKKDAINIKEDM